MTAARSASLIPLQPPISDRVRQHPRHRLFAPSTMQTLTQGVAIDRGGPVRAGLSPSSRCVAEVTP
ncbi:hypothetical protein BH10PSE2_BH10PSE2_12990 [soil metagenome]